MPPPPRVFANIAGPPLVATAAGLNVALDASGSVCLVGSCSTYVYTVTCPGRAVVQLSGTQSSNVVTTGAGAGYSIDMQDQPGGINCSVAVVVTDGGGKSANASIDLQVRREGGRAACAQAGRRCRLRSRVVPASQLFLASTAPWKPKACCSWPQAACGVHVLLAQVSPLPVANIDGAPLLSVTAGSPAVINANASTCSSPPCTTAFVVVCGGKIITRSGTSTTTTLTTGSGSSNDVDMTGLARGNCSVTVTVTDVNGAPGTATATLLVGGRTGCWRMHSWPAHPAAAQLARTLQAQRLRLKPRGRPPRRSCPTS